MVTRVKAVPISDCRLCRYCARGKEDLTQALICRYNPETKQFDTQQWKIITKYKGNLQPYPIPDWCELPDFKE